MEDFIQYASSVLGPKEVRQFKNAVERPVNEFHKRVIAPQFYNATEQTYLALAVDKYLPGRNHLIAQAMLEDDTAWHALTYFTNPLSIAPAPQGEESWVAPKERIVWGKSQVMTFEFDQPDLNFFSQQLAWCRSSTGKQLNCEIGELYRACSEWIDFEGITVNYSGNKSFHIHIVFNTSHAITRRLTENIRHGLNLQWHKLHEVVMEKLQPGVQPDMGMWEPEKFRRLPNGVRELEKQNIIGMPVGSKVPQVTIWEKFRDRANKGSSATFFDPTFFVPPPVQHITRSSKSTSVLPSDPELDFCRTKMSELFNDNNLPAFHDFCFNNGAIRAHFKNHAGDKNPASFMDSDYRTVSINGSNPFNLTPSSAPHLPKPLGAMMSDWCAEFQQLNTQVRSPVEENFAKSVVSRDSAPKEMASLLTKVIREEKLALICAPEGISKTRGLFKNHNHIDRWLRDQGDGKVMYAFADYNSAIDKAAEFNACQRQGKHRAVVLESFDRAYENACSGLGIQKIAPSQAASLGFPSVWAAIERQQPAVLDVFQQKHRHLWNTMGDASPVFFAVHAVAHNWSLSSHSRLMWAPSFWAQGLEGRASLCRDEMKLGLLVHDELKVDDLVAAYPASKVRWVKEMIAHHPSAWRRNSTAMERFASFNSFSAKSTPDLPITFDEAQDIFGFSGHEWDQVTTRDSGEYGNLKNAYANAIGKDWCIIERNWPTESASRTIALTTETVPLNIARRSSHDWAIFDLDTPRIKADVVEVHAQRGVTGNNLPKLCADWQQSHPGISIISNKVAHLQNTVTHAAARGSNKLMGMDILQTMTFMTPVEFEKFEALNAWTGMDTLVRHRHIDEFNQDAGRNLSYRKRGKAKHYLLVNKTLFDLLVGAPMARARYEMHVMMNRHQRSQALQFKVRKSGLSSKAKLRALRTRLRNDRLNEQLEPYLSAIQK
ncbi:hypothetical protein LC612_29410 [Nostoc sp. CHAB 5834]|nr:hypothetical protein [Nostoc sp. CHAB 5834]